MFNFFCHATGNNHGATEILSFLFVLLHHMVKQDLMCGKLCNEDKHDIDQDSDVCTIGVQNIMQSYHGMPRNQNKLKIPLTSMLFYRPTSWCEKSKVCMVSKI